MLFIFISSSFLLECYMVYVVFTFYHHSICLSCLYEAMVARMQPCIVFYSVLSPILLRQPTYMLREKYTIERWCSVIIIIHGTNLISVIHQRSLISPYG